jgi:hypothetical protein
MVHGTRIDVAVSEDHQATWTCTPPPTYLMANPTAQTVYWHSQYHMFLVIVPGLLKTGTPHVRSSTSPVLTSNHGPTFQSWTSAPTASSNLSTSSRTALRRKAPTLSIGRRRVRLSPIAAKHHKVFRWKGQYWMITDAWNVLLYASKRH